MKRVRLYIKEVNKGVVDPHFCSLNSLLKLMAFLLETFLFRCRLVFFLVSPGSWFKNNLCLLLSMGPIAHLTP